MALPASHPLPGAGLAAPMRARAWLLSMAFIFLNGALNSACLSERGSRPIPARDPATDSNGAQLRFKVAQGILKVRCASCHQAFGRYTEEDWIKLQYVIPGSAMTSPLYRALRGSGAGGSMDQDMPPSGPLSSQDRGQIKDWIEGIEIADTEPEAESDELTAVERTQAALQVISVSCKSCHAAPVIAQSAPYSGASVPAFGNFTADGDFAISGLIISGDPRASWLYRSLKRHGDLNLMPKDRAAISDEAARSLSDWIERIGEP